MDMKVRQTTFTKMVLPLVRQDPAYAGKLVARAMMELARQGYAITAAQVVEHYDPNYLSETLVIEIESSDLVDLGKPLFVGDEKKED